MDKLFSDLTFLNIDILLPHETHFPQKAEQILNRLEREKLYQLSPILIDKDSKVIIDGHHRFEALKKYGAKEIPCILCNYSDPRIIVFEREIGGKNIDKQEIISNAKKHNLYPQKFTCHAVQNKEGEFIHISKVINHVSLKLDE